MRKGVEIALPVINRLVLTGLGHSKSRRTSKLHYWFSSYGDFAEVGGVCLLEELHWEGSAPAACAAGLFSKSYCTQSVKGVLLVLVIN